MRLGNLTKNGEYFGEKNKLLWEINRRTILEINNSIRIQYLVLN
jgi:hypothetical protein